MYHLIHADASNKIQLPNFGNTPPSSDQLIWMTAGSTLSFSRWFMGGNVNAHGRPEETRYKPESQSVPPLQHVTCLL